MPCRCFDRSPPGGPSGQEPVYTTGARRDGGAAAAAGGPVASSVSASGPITASAADGVTTGDATCTVGVGGFPATLLASLQVGEAGTTSCTTYADRASSGTIGD